MVADGVNRDRSAIALRQADQFEIDLLSHATPKVLRKRCLKPIVATKVNPPNLWKSYAKLLEIKHGQASVYKKQALIVYNMESYCLGYCPGSAQLAGFRQRNRYVKHHHKEKPS